MKPKTEILAWRVVLFSVLLALYLIVISCTDTLTVERDCEKREAFINAVIDKRISLLYIGKLTKGALKLANIERDRLELYREQWLERACNY